MLTQVDESISIQETNIIFEMFDKDKSGSVSVKEFAEVWNLGHQIIF